MKEEKFSEMLNKYKKTVQISFEEYKEKTKEDSKEVFQYMVYKMANDDIKIFEQLEIKDKEINRLNNIINGLEKYIHNELVLDFYNDDMPCELIINKMEKMIKELKEK